MSLFLGSWGAAVLVTSHNGLTQDDGLPAGHRLGPIRLARGISVRQTMALIVAAMISVSLQAFMPLMLPYLLEAHLKIPAGSHGTLVGTFSLVQNLVLALTILPLGGMADQVGRRRFLALALACFALSCILYPFAGTIAMFVGISIVIGIGQSAHNAGNGTSVIDYPDNGSRGKFVCLMLLTQGFASAFLIGRGALHLPAWLAGTGVDRDAATTMTYWLVAILAAAGAIIAATMMFLDPNMVKRRKAGAQQLRETMAGFRAVIAHARTRPRFRLVLLVACVMRGDFAVVATFLSLWVIAVAKRQGVAAADAMVIAGSMFALLSITSSLSPIVFGWLADRVDRVRLLLFSLLISGGAFLLPLLVSDVIGWAGFAMIAAIGVTEGAIVVAAQSVLGEEAPPHLRGSTYALFALLGISGLMIINFLGGFLFDRVSNMSPFILIGFLNLLIFLIVLRAVRVHKGNIL